MPWAFWTILAVVVAFVVVAYRYSSRMAGHITLVTAAFWVCGMATYWLNVTTFPDDETLREIGEGIPALIFLVALPLSCIALILTFAGFSKKKEA